MDIIQQKTAKSQYGLRFFGNGLAGYAIMALTRDHERAAHLTRGVAAFAVAQRPWPKVALPFSIRLTGFVRVSDLRQASSLRQGFRPQSDARDTKAVFTAHEKHENVDRLCFFVSTKVVFVSGTGQVRRTAAEG